MFQWCCRPVAVQELQLQLEVCSSSSFVSSHQLQQKTKQYSSGSASNVCVCACVRACVHVWFIKIKIHVMHHCQMITVLLHVITITPLSKKKKKIGSQSHYATSKSQYKSIIIKNDLWECTVCYTCITYNHHLSHHYQRENFKKRQSP